MDFETRAIHVGQEPDSATGAVTTPIYQTSTYAQEAVGVQQGIRLRARRQPDAHGARGVPRLARECRLRARLLVGPRRGDDDHAPRRPRRAARLRERRLRRHVPDVLPGLRAQGLRLRLHHAGRGLDQPRRPPRRAHADRVGRVTHEPAAEHRRPPRRSRRGACRRRPARGRQHLRDAVPPAAARARRGHRRPLDDEVPRRPLRRRSADSSPRTTPRSRNGSGSCRSRLAPSPALSMPGSCCVASRRSPSGCVSTARTPAPWSRSSRITRA